MNLDAAVRIAVLIFVCLLALWVAIELFTVKGC